MPGFPIEQDVTVNLGAPCYVSPKSVPYSAVKEELIRVTLPPKGIDIHQR